MERRGCNLGCIVTGLGLVLSCCLLPYLISSIYSIITALLQVAGAPDWLWGDWISTVASGDETLYMILAEGPVCCVGAVGLLIIVLGLVMTISGLGQREVHEAGEESVPDEEYEYEYEYEES